jgi:hypothetical protein
MSLYLIEVRYPSQAAGRGEVGGPLYLRNDDTSVRNAALAGLFTREEVAAWGLSPDEPDRTSSTAPRGAVLLMGLVVRLVADAEERLEAEAELRRAELVALVAMRNRVRGERGK